MLDAAAAPLAAGRTDAERYGALARPAGGAAPDAAQARERAAMVAAVALADPGGGEDGRSPSASLA